MNKAKVKKRKKFEYLVEELERSKRAAYFKHQEERKNIENAKGSDVWSCHRIWLCQAKRA